MNVSSKHLRCKENDQPIGSGGCFVPDFVIIFDHS
jgi:hypothetical protein